MSEIAKFLFTPLVLGSPSFALMNVDISKLVEVDLGNSDLALYPGMYATMEIRLRAGSGAPRAPDDALVFRGGKVYLPLVRGNRIRLVPVALGLDDGREVEITNGIRPDDLIALNLGQSVRDGAPVQPVETASR